MALHTMNAVSRLVSPTPRPLAPHQRQHFSRRTCAPVVCMASQAKFFVGGNWKANGTLETVHKLVSDLNKGSFSPLDVDVVVAPVSIHLDCVRSTIDRTKYEVAAQNVWLTGPGAYTGEVPAELLKDLSIKWAIVGHSERRSLCGETNEVVAKKAARALEVGLNVIPCIGETLDQRRSGKLFDVLDAQVQALVDSITDWSRVVIAYEPVWAIGTGVVATQEQAQEVHAYLRKVFTSKLGADIASNLRIIYGGSVSEQNCDELARCSDIDGFLVGGASLKGPTFLQIIDAHHAKKAVGAY